MHAIASAIADSLRTSMAPTGSRILPPPWILPLLLGVQLSRGRRCGAPGPVAGQPAPPRANAEAAPLHSFSYGSLGRGDGLDPSGWFAQPLVYAVVHPESAAGSPAQPRVRWLPGMQLALIKSPQVILSSAGLDFPWVAGAAEGYAVGPPGNGNSQGR
jgi:hypothetical protein